MYHTGLVNGIMTALIESDSADRDMFLKTGELPNNTEREPVSTSIFNVLSHARNLRPVVHKLINGVEVDGCKLNRKLSLEDLKKKKYPSWRLPDFVASRWRGIGKAR